MKPETGDIVTITGSLVNQNATTGAWDVLLNDDIRIVVPADFAFTTIRKPPYHPKAGHWVTWGDGTQGYQILWVNGDRASGGHMLLRRYAYEKPFVRDISDLDNLRRCYGPGGDAEPFA